RWRPWDLPVQSPAGAGRGAAIPDARFTPWTFALAAPLCFPWLGVVFTLAHGAGIANSRQPEPGTCATAVRPQSGLLHSVGSAARSEARRVGREWRDR